MSPRTGRPKGENSNTTNLTIRINQELNKKLEEYCQKTNSTKGDVVRRGIERIVSEKE